MNSSLHLLATGSAGRLIETSSPMKLSPMRPSLLQLSLLTLCLGSSVGMSPAQTAIDFSATAGSGSNWANNANWVGGVAPADDLTTNLARFNQTSYANQPNAGTRSIAGIVVGDGSTNAAALTITGTTLSLGSSGILINASTGATTISATNLTLGANQTWTNNSANLFSVSSALGGSGALEYAGSGALSLSGGTYSGGLTLTSGNLRINGTAAAGTGTLALNGGILSTSGSSSRVLTNNVTIGGDVQLGVTGISGLVTLDGPITVNGNRQLSFVNTGSILSGAMTLNGNLTLDTQITAVGTGNTLVSAIGEITSARSLTKTGTGTIVLTGANTYSGGTAINAGQLWVGSTTALGTGTVTFGGGALDLRGQNLVVNALAGSSGSITDTNSAGTRTLTVGQGGNSGSFGGTITQSTSTKIVALTKTGNGTQTFTGNNTYIGQTIVSQGTLLINGTHVDATATVTAVNGYGSTSTGHFQVASGANLGGTGRIQGNSSLANSNLVLVQSGGFLAPGDGVGTLTLDGATFSGSSSRVLNLASGALLKFDLAGNGTSADQVQLWNYVSGDVLFNGNAINLTLNGVLVAGTYTVDLFRFYSNSGTTLAASGIASGLVVGTLGAGIQSANLAFNANTISLTYSVIPEPSSALLFGVGAFLILQFRRRTLSNK